MYNKIMFLNFLKIYSHFIFSQEGGEQPWQKRKPKRKSPKENQRKRKKRLRKNEDNV